MYKRAERFSGEGTCKTISEAETFRALPQDVVERLPEETKEAGVEFRRRYEDTFSEKKIEEGGVLVIIPAHNEEKLIGETLKSFFGAMGEVDLEIVLVCDNCTDNTASEAKKTCEELNKKVTIIEREEDPGKIKALLSTKGFVEKKERIPEYVFVLDADTRVKDGYVERLKETLDKDEKMAAVSGKINFYTKGGGELSVFSEVINNIHGVKECGGNWIPGGAFLSRIRNFYAGYEMIEGWYPDSMVEDVTWKVFNNLTGFRTKIRDDLELDTLAPTGQKAVRAQMERWLGGLAQLKNLFGEVLEDFGLNSRLEKIVIRQITLTLSTSENMKDLVSNIRKLMSQIPMIKEYLDLTLANKNRKMGKKKGYSWETTR